MTDLDTRLRDLTDLSPPSRAPLGTDELHRRATRNQRRALALRAVPAAVVVVALLAGAVVLRSRDAGSEITVTTPDTTATTGAGLSERDQAMVGFLITAADLRHQLNRESVLTGVFEGSVRTTGEAELEAQRTATDAAMGRYREALASVQPGEGAPALTDAIKQADNRLVRIDVLRRSVDASQSDVYSDLDAYANTIAALGDVAIQYLQGVEQPALFRGALTASNFGTVADLEAATAGRLTVAVELGYYPFTTDLMGTGPSPSGSGVSGCGGDASAAGSSCAAYAETIGLSNDAAQAELTFQAFANDAQKVLARAAVAGDPYAELLRAAFEDGVGQNDLRGTTPRSQAIAPDEWRAAVLGHLDRMADAERQLYEMIETAAADPGPGPSVPPTTDTHDGGMATTTSPLAPEPSSGPAEGDEDGGGLREPSATGTMPPTPPTEREVVLEPNPADGP